MAQLTFIKFNITSVVTGYRAETKSGVYTILRHNSRFLLHVNGEAHGKPGTLASCKAVAQIMEDEGTGNVMTTPPQDTVTGATTEDLATFINPEKTAERLMGNMGVAADVFKGERSGSQLVLNKDTHPRIQPANRPSMNTEVKPVSGLVAALTRKPAGSNPPHVIVEARAGTGKTTTLVEGLKVMRGLPSKITPSEQQAAVWAQLKLSTGAGTVCFVAFNKSIASELQQRVPAGCDAMTMHSMGFKAVTRQYRTVKVESNRTAYLISELLEKDLRDLRRESPVLLDATEKLVKLCKMNLVQCVNDEVLVELASYYDIDLCTDGGRSYRAEVFSLVPQVLERARDVSKDSRVDFDDMIWIPVVLGLPVWRYDLLLVDEAQDLNRCQQALARMAGRRLVLCGDPRQAIYGFAGADAESMPRMARDLSETPAGCVTLPLTVTRRCGRAIVAEANRIVKDFSAHESNPDGMVSAAKYPGERKTMGGAETTNVPWEKSYGPLVEDGDMVLCRVNAPLVSQCFKFLRAGRKANIQGRDIGAGLISLIKKLKASGVDDLVGKVTDWADFEAAKEQAKKMPNENKVLAITDKADCVVMFTESAATVDAVINKIESVFTDDQTVRGVRLSSIHKAKGLEAERVFLLRPKGAECPHPMAKQPWAREQESNLLYVAVTRAINELVFVS
jgi:DNA helicase-2/ATP-dependent DNA helicase PcrA